MELSVGQEEKENTTPRKLLLNFGEPNKSQPVFTGGCLFGSGYASGSHVCLPQSVGEILHISLASRHFRIERFQGHAALEQVLSGACVVCGQTNASEPLDVVCDEPMWSARWRPSSPSSARWRPCV